MSSQPGGGPAIPAAAAVSGLANEDDDSDFVTADDNDSQTDDGVAVGSADAEQDRVRASDESDEQS